MVHAGLQASFFHLVLSSEIQDSKVAAFLQPEGIMHVWIDGGITVSRFLEAGLVDDITIGSNLGFNSQVLFGCLKGIYRARYLSNCSAWYS